MKRTDNLYRNRPFIIFNSIIMLLAVAMNPLLGSALAIEENNERLLECCMTAPFETGAAEAELTLESWMTAPFETDAVEAELTLEAWMTAPFDSKLAEPELAIEQWMTSAFQMVE